MSETTCVSGWPSFDLERIQLRALGHPLTQVVLTSKRAAS
jgi:hypothetical protein